MRRGRTRKAARRIRRKTTVVHRKKPGHKKSLAVKRRAQRHVRSPVKKSPAKPASRRTEAKKPAPEKPKQNVYRNILTGTTTASNLGRQFIETKVDELYKTVQKEKSLALEEAAKKFQIPESRIEEWALILENHHLIRMHYPKFGKPVLRSLAEKSSAHDSSAQKTPKKPMDPKKKKKLIMMSVLGIVLALVLGWRFVSWGSPYFGNIPSQTVILLIGIVALFPIGILVIRKKRKKRAVVTNVKQVDQKDEKKHKNGGKK